MRAVDVDVDNYDRSPGTGRGRTPQPAQHDQRPGAVMSAKDRAAVRQANAEDARRSRARARSYRSGSKTRQRSWCSPLSCVRRPHPDHQGKAFAMKPAA